jgi:hypothetical protein
MVQTTLTQNKQSVFDHLGKISANELSLMKAWLTHIQPFMSETGSIYAKGRKDLHLGYSVKFVKKDGEELIDEVTKVPESLSKKYQSELIESIGERLLPGFHQGLVLYYPKGTLIKIHRDSRAYDKAYQKGRGAASVNIIGNAKFLISHQQSTTNLEEFELGEGDCIRFDNNQPHAVAKVQEDRWCVCFFYLKEEYLPKPSEQLALFSTVQTTNPNCPDNKPELSRQQTRTVQIPKIYTSYYRGEQIGKSISISLYKPGSGRRGHDFEHEDLFAPSKQLLNDWQKSNQGAGAIASYTKQFLSDMAAKDQRIDEWLDKIEDEGVAVTLNCYEEDSPDYIDNPFCHRHLVGKIIKQKRPSLWGGEVSYAILSNFNPTPPNIGYIEGEKIKYYCPKSATWVDAIFKQVHTTSFSKPDQFSFIEVLVNHKIHMAFTPSQIRKSE